MREAATQSKDPTQSSCRAMQVVYLDQNAASYLAKPAGPIWGEIRESLSEGLGRRKLICPLPFECLVESAPRDLQFRQSIQSLFWQLSAGVAFKDYTEISSELTLALIRPTPHWSPWKIWKPGWAEMEGVAKNVSANWKAEKEHMIERMKDFLRSPKVEVMSIRELFHAVAAQRSGRLLSDLNRMLESRIAGGSLNYPWLIEFLISMQVSPAELEALKRAVRHHGWASIPIHALEILVGAKWEHDSIHGGSAKYAPNDEIDRKRAAIALSYADVFITEGDLANLCRKAKVREYCPTVVLSVREPQEVLKTIRAVIDAQDDSIQSAASPAKP